MTKRRYRFLPTEMVASEKQECFQGERSELGTGAMKVHKRNHDRFEI